MCSLKLFHVTKPNGQILLPQWVQSWLRVPELSQFHWQVFHIRNGTRSLVKGMIWPNWLDWSLDWTVCLVETPWSLILLWGPLGPFYTYVYVCVRVCVSWDLDSPRCLDHQASLRSSFLFPPFWFPFFTFLQKMRGKLGRNQVERNLRRAIRVLGRN